MKPPIQNPSSEGASAIAASPAIQAASTAESVRRGPHRSQARPASAAPTTAGIVSVTKRRISPPVGRPSTVTA